MNETKRQATPGPWRVRKPDLSTTLYERRVIIETDRPNETRGVEVGRANWSIARDSAEANARLMSAAPELLAVLEDILNVTNLKGLGHVLEAKAVAAIAKAKGD